MSRQDRLSQILEIVVKKEVWTLNTSLMRWKFQPPQSDAILMHWQKKQLLSRTHGGAVATGGSLGLPLTYKVAKEDEVKQRIAAAAADMVSRYDIIGINGGTTTTAVARAIVERTEFAPGDSSDLQPALTVVTNAVNIAAELTVRHQVKIVVTGGVVRPQSYELTGAFAEEVLKEVNIDIAFLGVEAIDSVIGAAAQA